MFQYSLTASSVNVDGLHNGVEWDGTTVTQLFSGESNSNVDYALVKTMIDAENSALFLCFMFSDSLLEPDNTNAGISVTADNSEEFIVTLAESRSYFDTSAYSFDGAIAVDKNNGATCEIRIGFKNGLSEEIDFDVRFIDSSGNFSNVYNFSVINKYYSETTEIIITEKEIETQTESDEETTEKVKTTKLKTTKEKTTKTKTTVHKTTKPKTTKLKTTKAKKTTEYYEKTTDYTLKKATTKSKKTTKFYIQTSPPYNYVRKTKDSKTTKPIKTTVVEKESKHDPVTAYYYEKEVIISQVYVTPSVATDAVTALSSTEISEITSSEIPVTEQLTTEAEKSVSLSEGTKYKILIGVFAAVSFTVIAAAGSRSAKKNSDNDNTPDSQ